MTLSKRTLETLIDLVEIKLSCVEIYDRDDARELSALEQCRGELLALGQGDLAVAVVGRPDPGAVVSFPKRSRGRPRAAH